MKLAPATAAGGVAEVDYSAGVHYFADLFARAIIIVLFSMMAVRFATDFFETGRITGLFLLLSEAGIPLYSGLTLYHQLMTEEKSRINACPLVSLPRS